MIIIVSNYDVNDEQLKRLKYDQYIYFNPWGFSKKILEKSFNEALKNIMSHEKVELNLYFKNKYFGKRVL